MPWELGPDGDFILVPDAPGGGGGTSTSGFEPTEIGGYSYGPDGQLYIVARDPRIPGKSSVRPARFDEIAAFNSEMDRIRNEPSRSQSSSYNVSQSLADPRSLQLQYDQLAQEQLQWERQQSFLEDKFQIETDAGRRQEALQTRQLLEQIGARLANNQIQRQQIQQQADQFQRQMAFEQAVEQQRAQTEARRFAEEQRQFNAEQQRRVATDIAATASRPGDVGQNAALLTALGQPNAISSAIAGGKDLRTEQSLAPLEMLLQQRDQLQNPGMFNQAMAPGGSFEAPNGGTGFGGLPTGSPEEAAAREASLRNQLQGQLNAILTGNPSTVAPGTPIEASLAGLAGTPGSAIGQDGSSFFAKGGTAASGQGYQGAMAQSPALSEMEKMTGLVFAADGFNGVVDDPTMFIAGEGVGPEHVNIQPVGQAHLKTSAPRSEPQTAGQQMLRQVSVPQTPQTQTPRTLQFLNDALRRIFGSGPFNQIPTPIGLSAPGTSPYLQQYGASIASLGAGVDPGLFLNETMQLAPRAMQQGITRRI